MVTEMTKYSFILLEEESEGFMQQLQQLGVVDITRSAKPVDGTSSEMLERAAAEKKAMALLSKTCYDKDPDIGAKFRWRYHGCKNCQTTSVTRKVCCK